MAPIINSVIQLKAKAAPLCKVEDVETVQTYINEYHKLKALMNDLSESSKKFKQHGWKYQKNV